MCIPPNALQHNSTHTRTENNVQNCVCVVCVVYFLHLSIRICTCACMYCTSVPVHVFTHVCMCVCLCWREYGVSNFLLTFLIKIKIWHAHKCIYVCVQVCAHTKDDVTETNFIFRKSEVRTAKNRKPEIILQVFQLLINLFNFLFKFKRFPGKVEFFFLKMDGWNSAENRNSDVCTQRVKIFDFRIFDTFCLSIEMFFSISERKNLFLVTGTKLQGIRYWHTISI